VQQAVQVDYGILYQNGLNTNAAGDGHCQIGQVGVQEETAANGFLYSSCTFLTKMTHLLLNPASPPTMNPFDRLNPDWRQQNDGAAASGFDPVNLNASLPGGPFFESAPYYGAIKPGTLDKDNWTRKPWTSYTPN